MGGVIVRLLTGVLSALVIVMSFAFTQHSNAEVSSSKSSSVVTPKDLDTEIVDIKMRADSGAKSQFSTSLYFNYSGSALDKPFDDKRPNIGEGRIENPVTASWNLGVRERKSKNESFYFATGFSRNRPFNSRKNNDDEIEISTPHAVYNNTFAVNDLQLSSSFRLYITTLDYLKAIGQVGTVGYSLSAMSMPNVIQSRLSAGVSMNTWFSVYNKSDDKLKRQQNDYGISLTPTLQYKVNDRANIFSSWSLWNYSHYRSDVITNVERSHVTQTIGMGVAIFRDFYVAPNLSFFTSDIAAKKTSVNLNATINL